jgi:hypothetical protein
MRETRLAQLVGACAVIGGSSWTAVSIIHASQPRGCVGDECAYLPMRDAATGTSVLVAVAAMALSGFVATLLLLIRQSGHLGWTGVAGAAACGFAVGLLALAMILQELLYDGDFPWMPAGVIPAGIAVTAGLALVGWTILRSRVVPTWAGASLLIGALLLVGTNEQTSAVLLAVPFGIAWLCTGAALLRPRQPGLAVDAG